MNELSEIATHDREGVIMILRNIKPSKMLLPSMLLLIGLFGCSEPQLDIGKWYMKDEAHQYAILTDKEAKEVGEIPPAPCPPDIIRCWMRVKDVGETPDKLKQKLEPYSVVVIESGYSFLGVTRNVGKDKMWDDIEWGWKIILENKGKQNIYAYGRYALFDKDGFILENVGNDWDNNESGVLVEPGAKVTIQGRSHWLVNRASKPYTVKRVVRGDYKLFLRHGRFIFED